MPAYNRAGVIGRAVRSVLAQTMADFELVVIDDGSTDDTAAVVAAFSDPRIRLLRLERNAGLSHARNEGIRAVRARFVAFLDSDDEWLPAALERQTRNLVGRQGRPPAVSVCLFCRHDEATGRTRPAAARFPAREPFRALVRGWNPMPSCVVAERSSLLEVGGFDAMLTAFDDHDLWLRLARASVGFACLGEVLVVRHEHGVPQISSDPDGLLVGLRRLDRKWAAVIRRETGTIAYYRWWARFYTSTRYVLVRRAVADGRRFTAWRAALEACRGLPWSAYYVTRSLFLAAAGLAGYGALTGLKDGWDQRRRRRRLGRGSRP
jgi:glycosyltransferase involved in cell wall biosynthesis